MFRRNIISEFLIIFVIILIVVFAIFNFSTIYSLVYYQFQKTVPLQNNKDGTLLKSYKNKIIIPKISLIAPIIFSSLQKAEILDNLKKGVVYIPKGKSKEKKSGILLGHSSRLLYSPGKYDIVFLFLSKLEKSDKIFVYFQGKKFTYEVAKESKILSDLSFLNFNKKQPTLYLVTCWPPGTNLKRLVVEAKLK